MKLQVRSVGLLALVASVLAAAPAFAIDQGACCVQGTSRLEALMNPNKGSDEAFFSSGGAPPNITLVLDTSCSMNAWPQNWPTSEGCSGGSHDTFAGAGYDPGTTYRPVIADIDAMGNEVPNPRWFNNEMVYRADGTASPNQSPIGHDLNGNPHGGSYSTRTWSGTGTFVSARDQSCDAITTNSTYRSNCRTCLTNKGYYVLNSTTRLAAGNFLRYYPPRDVSALMVLSHLLFDIREVRLSVMTFNDWSNPTNAGNECWGGSVCMWRDASPDCDQLSPFDQSAVTTRRKEMLAAMATNRPFTSGTPLASSLYAAMYSMRSASAFDTMFGAGTYPVPPTGLGAAFTESGAAKKKRICNRCGFNAVIALTDGEPSGETISSSSYPAAITGMATTCSGGACGSRLDEIAAYFWQQGDLRDDEPGVQRVATYTIGFGTNSDANGLLGSAASAGGGSHFSASNAAGVVQAFQSIFEDISSRNTSFATAAVASVQTGSSSTPAVLPRLVPRQDQAWLGRLWRFDQYNEFVEEWDLNGDGDRDDVFVVEKPCASAGECAPAADGGRPETADNIVTEDSSGRFVRASDMSTVAREYWEGNDALVGSANVAAIDARRVWTVVDSNNDGAFTNEDKMLRIQLLPLAGTHTFPDGSTVTAAAYDDMLAEYMGLKHSDRCPSSTGPGTLLSRAGLTTSTAWGVAGWSVAPLIPLQSDFDRLCARIVIMWTLGYDLLNANVAAKSTTMRADALGDIFHSSPIAVEPPLEPFLCDLGLSTQCARTIYADLGIGDTQHDFTVSASLCPTGTAITKAYDVWQARHHRRQRVLLVGANDGMVHAFDNGRAIDDANALITGTNNTSDVCTAGRPLNRYSHGTGQELWAFVPPDLLSRLPDQLLGHQYMVDGDIMVRDIWADEDQDGVKDADEFHTLAVISEGRGGTHYLALEVPFALSGDRAMDAERRPNFRWMYPQPCSAEAATFGKTFFSLSPKAPPIGPIIFDNGTLETTEAAAVGIPRMGVANTVERWVVALSGGWTPGLERGRGVYVVDAWAGTVGNRRDNLWWKYEYDATATGENAPKRAMTHSIPAPIALVDYGADRQPGQDNFFDTAVWGDTAGQIWLARFADPAIFDTTTQTITNWSVARALELDRNGGSSVANKNPFFYLPSVAIEPGNNRLRVFMGSGNRYALLERGAGMCRYDNPLACAKANCDSTAVEYTRNDGFIDIDEASNRWGSRTFSSADYDFTKLKNDTAPVVFTETCGVPGTPRVEAEVTQFRAEQCGISNTSPGAINESRFRCGMFNGAFGGYSCEQVNVSRNGSLGDLLNTSDVSTSGLGTNRFVGFWAYGNGLHFGGDAGSAADFDTARLSDRDGDLVDVTTVTCTSTSCTGGATADTDRGWAMDYDVLEAKTATGAAVVASCVLWSDLTPGADLDGGVNSCGGGLSSVSRIFQGDFITGQPNCAYGFLNLDAGTYVRSQGRGVLSPPPEPASVVQVSKSGQVRYSAMMVEPGQSQATTVDVTGTQDILQVVYELPITRALHNCRHADGGCVTSP